MNTLLENRSMQCRICECEFEPNMESGSICCLECKSVAIEKIDQLTPKTFEYISDNTPLKVEPLSFRVKYEYDDTGFHPQRVVDVSWWGNVRLEKSPSPIQSVQPYSPRVNFPYDPNQH